MNQEQVKETLLRIKDDVPVFTITFSGKQSKKVNGLYKPETAEIIIHNKNFSDNNNLLYTAIHEYAHHVHITQSAKQVSSRAHTREFRSIFHALLAQGERIGGMTNIFDSEPDFIALTKRIKDSFLNKQGELARKFGKVLIEAEELCHKHGVRFEDYVERVLQLDNSSARFLIKSETYGLPRELGYENMKLVAAESNGQYREELSTAILQGETRDRAKVALNEKKKAHPKDPKDELLEEKERLHRSLVRIQEKIDTIDRKLNELQE